MRTRIEVAVQRRARQLAGYRYLSVRVRRNVMNLLLERLLPDRRTDEEGK